MGRSPCCSKEGLNRGAWTAIEDNILANYITTHGEGKWRNLPERAGLKRCGKSCRLRWLNYLRPDIKRGNISIDEEDLIIRLHKILGNRWSLIAGRLPGRTDNEIKNYWNTCLRKKTKLSQSLSSASSLPPPSSVLEKFDTKKLHNKLEIMSKPSQTSQVIRTKAIRCTKVVIPTLPPPSPPSLESQTREHKLGSNTENTVMLMDKNLPQRSRYDYSNVEEDFMNIDWDYFLNNSELGDNCNEDLWSIMGSDHHHHHHHLPLEDENLLFKEYDDNANLELEESLALLLNSNEEWSIASTKKNDILQSPTPASSFP